MSADMMNLVAIVLGIPLFVFIMATFAIVRGLRRGAAGASSVGNAT